MPAHDGCIPVNKLPCVCVLVVPIFPWLKLLSTRSPLGKDGKLITTEALTRHIPCLLNHVSSMMSIFVPIPPYSLQLTVSSSQSTNHHIFNLAVSPGSQLIPEYT